MVSSNNGQIKLAGSGEQILSDTLAILYSVRETFKDHPDFILNLELNTLKIFEGDFDDNVKFFGRFKSAEDAKEFLKSVKDKYQRMQATVPPRVSCAISLAINKLLTVGNISQRNYRWCCVSGGTWPPQEGGSQRIMYQ